MAEIASAAWLAGLMDGEAWIGMRRRKRGNSIDYRCQVQIVMASRHTIDTAKSVIGVGSIREHRVVAQRKPNWKQYWRLDVYRKVDIIKTLGIVLPYLVTKRSDADLVMEACSISPTSGRAEEIYWLLRKSFRKNAQQLVRPPESQIATV